MKKSSGNQQNTVKKSGKKEQYQTILEKEFDIELVKQDPHALKEALKKIMDRFDMLTDFLEDILQPENNYYSMHECSALTEQDKQAVFMIYKKCMYYKRSATVTLLKNDAVELKNTIENIANHWMDIKQNVITITIKIRDSWNTNQTENGAEEYKKYFG
jgi:hypothetical protein